MNIAAVPSFLDVETAYRRERLVRDWGPVLTRRSRRSRRHGRAVAARSRAVAAAR